MLKKFLVIHHINLYFHEFFRKSRSDRKVLGRKVLIIDFFPCYLNGKLRARATIQTGRIGPSYHMEYFFLFFGNYTRSDPDEKVYLGNNERPSVQCIPNIFLKQIELSPVIWVNLEFGDNSEKFREKTRQPKLHI